MTEHLNQNQNDSQDKLWTIEEVADYCKVHHTTVRRWISDTSLRSIRLGNGKKGPLRIIERDLKDFLLSRHPYIKNDKVFVNPNGVDVDRFKMINSGMRKKFDIPNDSIVIGFAGNFRFWHRLDMLIKAFNQFSASSFQYFVPLTVDCSVSPLSVNC